MLYVIPSFLINADLIFMFDMLSPTERVEKIGRGAISVEFHDDFFPA